MPFEPKIIAYLCTWCSYTGADTAGIARLKSPANIRDIRVPCSGRVSPEIIMRTFEQGADGVLVLGCHIGECHYNTGNHRAAKRLPVLRALLAYAGLEPERVRLDWVSASEGERYSHITNEFTETVRALGPIHWKIANRETHFVWEREPISHRYSAFSDEQPKHAVYHTPIHDEQTIALQAAARDLLTNNLVDGVIGFEVGPRGRTRPAFIHHPENVDRLVWNQDCTHNLTAYLSKKLGWGTDGGKKKKPDLLPKAAVVVKPCDSRSINVLLAENRFLREQVYIIGMACDGIRQGAGFNNDKSGPIQTRCAACSVRTPVIYDKLVGDPETTYREIPPEHVYPGIERLNALTPIERMNFWLSQFDRCIRCYACRQVCPMCDCPICLYERDDSLWVGMGLDVDEKRAYHLGRAYHLAGRCVGCNECERACPMDIPLSLIHRKMAQEMETIFGYQAGMAAVPPPFVTILGGEENLP
jgi:coenzyme F420-reducing hydrogenase delta subunit/formate hydrogenlyase subunit 6/NADH:ubiquinone oxidoreductase subunit I